MLGEMLLGVQYVVLGNGDVGGIDEKRYPENLHVDVPIASDSEVLGGCPIRPFGEPFAFRDWFAMNPNDRAALCGVVERLALVLGPPSRHLVTG